MKLFIFTLLSFSFLLSNSLESFLSKEDKNQDTIFQIIKENGLKESIIKNAIEEIMKIVNENLYYGMTKKRENEILFDIKKIINKNKENIKNSLYENISKEFSKEELIKLNENKNLTSSFNKIKEIEKNKLIENNIYEIQKTIKIKFTKYKNKQLN